MRDGCGVMMETERGREGRGNGAKPDRTVRALSRRPERIILSITGIYDILMASITVFVYASWLKGESYSILQEKGLLSSGMSDANSVVYVAQMYGFIVALVGVASLVVAARGMRDGSISRAVMIYVVVCAVGSLVTGDWLGLIGYSVTAAVYGSRNKAIRLYDQAPTRVV